VNTLLRGLGRTFVGMLAAGTAWVPAGLRDRLAGKAAEQAADDFLPQPMSGEEASLHAVPGYVCATCGEPFRRTDTVRTLSKGVVHDVCPS
jgi:hypothetical protein